MDFSAAFGTAGKNFRKCSIKIIGAKRDTMSKSVGDKSAYSSDNVISSAILTEQADKGSKVSTQDEGKKD